MKIWIYVDGRQEGPFTLEELLDKPVTEHTKVWYEGLPKWYPAGYLDEMRPLFDGTLAAKSAANPDESAPAEEPRSEAESTETTSEETITIEETAANVEEVPETLASRYAPGRRYYRPQLDEPCPPTYIGWSIFLTICCCSPVSLAGLIASICVTSFYGNGQLKKAQKASDIACWLVMISFALGIIPVMLMSAWFGQ
ncbi:MAG: DUF4339 domain-containing protein [Bacteroidales bacterium]|nr:DUF4339 domain-containing protein [Bacteroidales bacterium]